MKSRKIISYFEISLVILATFAFSYVAYESYGIKEKQDNGIFNYIKKFFDLIPSVSAEGLQLQCCKKTKDNALCQDLLNVGDCADGQLIANTLCDQTSECKLGCCGNDVGIFDKNVPQSACKNNWYDDKNCNIPEARLGCCIIKGSSVFATEKQCEILSRQRGVEKNYNSNLNEAQCVISGQELEEGACVRTINGINDCKFITRQECSALVGSNNGFFKNTLCTAEKLNTSCKKTAETFCVTGRDGVYFKDSCGNRANIYDSLRTNDQAYWESVLPENEICNPGLGNANSVNCGNCNRFLGGICSSTNGSSIKPDSGNFYCKDTGCTLNGVHYKNGESWCVYDGAIGNGDDVVGSRDWKYVCNLGEIQIEPCADYRNQICVQKNIEIANSSETFKNAACIANNWRECINLNSQKDISSCNSLLDCETKTVRVGGSFDFDICTPKYPAGFQLTNQNQQKISSQICGLGTRTCVIQKEADFWGDCEIVDNEGCGGSGFTQQMNEVCKSLGDCGMEVNINGKTGSNVVSGLDPGYISRLVSLATPVAGQYAAMGNMTKYLQAAGIVNSSNKTSEESGGIMSSVPTYFAAGLGGIGMAAGMLSVGSFTGFGSSAYASSNFLGVQSAALGGFAAAAIGASIGAFAGSLLAKAMGASEGGALIATLAGAVAGASLMISTGVLSQGTMGIIGGLCSIGAACVIAAIAILFMIFGSLFGGGDCEPETITFTCEPWQAPFGGSDCGSCGKDPLKPCSEYRCNSLGASCVLLNKGTKDEKCAEDNPNDVNPPVITPSLVNLNNTKYSEITGNGFKITNLDGGCVDAYTNVVLSFDTNEPAQCRFGISPKNYNDLEFSFGSGYLNNHSMAFMFPNPENAQHCNLNWTGDLTLYVKCKDSHGNEMPNYYTINSCVNPGKDLTPPALVMSRPETNAPVGYSASSKDVEFYLNEPAECKWSKQDQDYAFMENNLSCQNSCSNLGGLNYCNTSFPIDSSNNTFYIRCKDQPWLENLNRGSERNTNQQSIVYSLKKASKPLNISSISPSGELDVNSTPSTVKLQVKTTGGSGITKCSYSFSGYDSLIQFYKTYTENHEQVFNSIMPGDYNIYVQCEDLSGDIARAETNFIVNYNMAPPYVSRIYYFNGNIKFVTIKAAECRYSSNFENGCVFDFANASSAGVGTEHSIPSSPSVYYIKCKDSANGQMPGGCTEIISPERRKI